MLMYSQLKICSVYPSIFLIIFSSFFRPSIYLNPFDLYTMTFKIIFALDHYLSAESFPPLFSFMSMEGKVSLHYSKWPLGGDETVAAQTFFKRFLGPFLKARVGKGRRFTPIGHFSTCRLSFYY